MSADNSNKRRLDEDESLNKRVHVDGLLDEQLNSLKESIKAQVSAEYEEKLATVTKQLQHFKDKCEELEKQLAKKQPPVLPPRAAPLLNPLAYQKQDTLAETSNKSAPVLKRQEATEVPNEKPKHTFGGTLFNIKPAVATPSNSVADNKLNNLIDTPKDSSSTTTPKSSSPTAIPVFGASTSFGSSSIMQNMKEKKSIFSDLPSQSTDILASKPQLAATTSSFGANSKFSNAFRSSMAKKSFLDEGADSDGNQEEQEQDSKPEQYKQVELAPVENLTGEEDEKSHFSSGCKLFELEFGNIKEGWKERGLGQLHLNQSLKDQKQVRLVMRSNGLLRVILNSKITKQTEIFKGLEASLASGKYLRFNSINENGKPVQYLLKFSNEGVRDDIFDKIENLKQQMD